jgi:hypothetical protein
MSLMAFEQRAMNPGLDIDKASMKEAASGSRECSPPLSHFLTLGEIVGFPLLIPDFWPISCVTFTWFLLELASHSHLVVRASSYVERAVARQRANPVIPSMALSSDRSFLGGKHILYSKGFGAWLPGWVY